MTKYVLITNIPGTAVPKKGSIDVVQNLLDDNLPVPAQCWWRDEIERRLDDAWNIKWNYPEMFSSHDLLRAIVQSGLTEHAERRTHALRAFVRDQFEFDMDVRFKQIDMQNKLLDLFMDVPINLREYYDTPDARRHDHHALMEIARQNDSLPPNSKSRLGTATLLLDAIAQEHLPRLVIEGAPGQGKSTIVQYICQVHRDRLLHGTNADGRICAKESKHLASPLRLPFKVECRDFSVWIGGKNPFSPDRDAPAGETGVRSLESFLAVQIEYASGGAAFSVSDLHAVLRTSSVLVVFDGLDEVADIRERRNVVDEITKGTKRVQDLSASLQTVVTSRPTVFANSPGLPRNTFLYLQLGSINRTTVSNYAKKWVVARQLRAREATDVMSTLEARLDEPHLRNLARNPMQLTILLSLIHRKGTSLPDKRTALYDSYMNLFFDREAEKSDIVRERRELLVDIHRYLAWILHSEAQTGQSGGRVESGRLRMLVTEFLERGGHDIDLVDQLFTGMVERVVALVSRIEGSYEFEIQPMREYFAARYLYDTAPYSPAGGEKPGTLPERFETLARDFFWLNVTRFYAGCYSQGQLPSLLTSLRWLAKVTEYRATCYPQALAVTLLADYTFAQYPLIVDEVVDFVLSTRDFRTIVACDQYARRGESLYLPKGSGNMQLVDRCFEVLQCTVQFDYSQIVVEILKANSTTGERKERWWRCLRDIHEESEFTRWIAIGCGLGTLEDCDGRTLDTLLAGNVEEYKMRVYNLAFNGMWEYVRANKEHVTTVVDMVLDRYNDGEFYAEESIIAAFTVSLSTHTILLTHGRRSLNAFSRIGDLFYVPNAVEDEVHDEEIDDGVLKRCRLFVMKNHELFGSGSAVAWTSSLAYWEKLGEYGRQLFGDRWAFCVLANSAAGVRSREDQCEEASDLFDTSVAVVRRARYARLSAGRWNWWRMHLGKATEQIDIAFLLLLLLTWSGPTVIVRLKTHIEERLGLLDMKWWRKLLRALEEQVAFVERRRTIDVTSDKFGTTMSERMAVAVWHRTNNRGRRFLFEKLFWKYKGDDDIVLEFCQDSALRAVFGEKDDYSWQLVDEIGDRYEKGIRSFVGRQPWMFWTHRKKMPLEIAERIVERSKIFPIALVRWAEHTCRANSAENVVPVGKVAGKQKWFDD